MVDFAYGLHNQPPLDNLRVQNEEILIESLFTIYIILGGYTIIMADYVATETKYKEYSIRNIPRVRFSPRKVIRGSMSSWNSWRFELVVNFEFFKNVHRTAILMLSPFFIAFLPSPGET